MCGRFTLARDADEIAAAFSADVEPIRSFHDKRYNVAPTDRVPIVISVPGGRRAGPMTWGIWTWTSPRGRPGGRQPAGQRARGRQPAGRPAVSVRRRFNARSETVATRPTFRDAFRRRRCLVPADGFYEWESTPSGKQPHWIHREDGALFAMAGVWSFEAGAGPGRNRPTGDRIATFAIVTRPAPPALQWLHHRLPVILDESTWNRWLARDSKRAALDAVMAAADGSGLRTHPVSRAVNRAGYDEPDCVARVTPEYSSL